MAETTSGTLSLLPNSAGAVFSDDRVYRYRLWRIWDSRLPLCNFIMLNPSIANETVLDPTVTRCVERAKRLGHGGLFVTNIFAFVATDPRVMHAAADPIGPTNNRHIIEVAQSCALVICGWGAHGGQRGKDVARMLSAYNVVPMALAFTQAGEPRHPLYLSYDLQPQRMPVTQYVP